MSIPAESYNPDKTMRNRPMSAIETLIIPRTRDLGDGFEVRRALPAAGRRMVGPFVFLDQMGPTVLKPGIGLDVRPHPHIGLATVTWLLEGEILHRDSLGTVQPIRAGEVNWMTAGRGIVHSERSDHTQRSSLSSLYGLQCWVALPRADEECEPDFTHLKADDLPVVEGEGAQLIMVAGSFMGLHSPLPTRSPLFYAQLRLSAGARQLIPAEYDEQALYIVSGELDLGDDGVFGAGQLLLLKPHQPLTLKAGASGAIVMLLGGEPMDGPRHLVWNFVSSREERIEQAKRDWIEHRFDPVPEETEWIPLPDNLKPVDYS
jgi:redox-sensitive bicupin YhaK (pirin superfamily)